MELSHANLRVDAHKRIYDLCDIILKFSMQYIIRVLVSQWFSYGLVAIYGFRTS